MHGVTLVGNVHPLLKHPSYRSRCIWTDQNAQHECLVAHDAKTIISIVNALMRCVQKQFSCLSLQFEHQYCKLAIEAGKPK